MNIYGWIGGVFWEDPVGMGREWEGTWGEKDKIKGHLRDTHIHTQDLK